jgi:hypothetical protein
MIELFVFIVIYLLSVNRKKIKRDWLSLHIEPGKQYSRTVQPVLIKIKYKEPLL